MVDLSGDDEAKAGGGRVLPDSGRAYRLVEETEDASGVSGMAWLVAFVMALTLVNPGTLSAENPKKQKGKSPHSQVTVVFSDVQREAAHLYFVEKHGRGNCPPGLAKKQNGCLPPGQAKKRYVIGHELPRGIVVAPIPVELSVRIGAAPPGYAYGIVDGDLVKLAVGTMLVVDAVEGLVH